MTNFLNESPVAIEWVKVAKSRHSEKKFGKLVSAVIWTDHKNDDGEPIVSVEPADLVFDINSDPYILLHNHDPGCPIGQVLEAEIFETKNGRVFVAAILGYFSGGDILSFNALNVDINEIVSSPSNLPMLPNDFSIQFCVDPKEVDSTWIDLVANDPTVNISRIELSHNSESSVQELIRVGLPYVLLVWNPFVTSIATEAGKSAYAASHLWIRKLIRNIFDRKNPIIDIKSFQNGCRISFILRGKNIEQHYKAHESLHSAAVQAAQLVENLKTRSTPARTLVYEFGVEEGRWIPSYAILNDGRIVNNRLVLISIEQLPSGLSLGLSRKVIPSVIEPTLKSD